MGGGLPLMRNDAEQRNNSNGYAAKANDFYLVNRLRLSLQPWFALVMILTFRAL